MKISTDRILTTHVGSLPRPDDLLELLIQEDRGEDVDQDALQAKTAAAIKTAVKEQVDNGVDVVCDGELGKMSYHIYAKHRLNGISNVDGSGVPGRKAPRDLQDFDGLDIEQLAGGGTNLMQATRCTGPVSYDDPAPVQRDIDNLKAAADATKPIDLFMNSASPGCLSTYVPNQYYPSRDEYRSALVAAMKPEYDAIHQAGFVLQLDCPDLAGSRHTDYQDMSEKEFLADAEKSIEALNAATADIPPEAMRMHICWLNYPGPHTHDIPIIKLIDLLNKARPAGLLFEGANPRHEHEWEDWTSVKINDDKILIPGVVDSTSNYVEHPVLIAQRLCRYANIVGRERVLAGTDCGFGTYAGRKRVFPSVVLGKFRAMAEGAKIATERLWG
jgi:5-methyltetrahydropteroyltriglutamate--homocysteine methyltransferase